MAQQGEQTTETKKVNTDFLSTYDFVEGTDFEGLMPAVMETLGEDYVTGKSDENVHYHGFMALGSDSLEVIDIAASIKAKAVKVMNLQATQMTTKIQQPKMVTETN